MLSVRLICTLGILLALPACQTQRTVLAGPTNTGTESQGQSDASARFSTQDPSGYLQNSSSGENAMSGKMFGGKLDSQTQKEFNASKNFLTREYGGKKDFATKSWKDGPKDQKWTDKLFDTDDTRDGDMAFQEAGKSAAVKENSDAGKMARTNDFADGDRMARAGNYRPAEKAQSDGRDNPKLTSAKPGNLSGKEKLVRDRIANSNATASDINKYLGKP